jgi:ABC-type transport system involved in Fe-S cluster assembly fused permease/ATPase subunit
MNTLTVTVSGKAHSDKRTLAQLLYRFLKEYGVNVGLYEGTEDIKEQDSLLKQRELNVLFGLIAAVEPMRIDIRVVQSEPTESA